MLSYYNEHDAKAAAWLRQLIADGQIAPGDVDERSITDVQPADLVGYTQCHFFAGIGGWSYALRLAGWPDDRPVWTGSCPCQPFSSAGKQRGTADERHLWPVWYRLIRECRPHVVFGEQVESAIAHGWLDLVCDDMEREGYAVGSVGLPAASVGAPHIRHRLWFVAYAKQPRERHDTRGMVASEREAESGESQSRPQTENVINGGTVDLLAHAHGRQQPGRPTGCDEAHRGRSYGESTGPSDTGGNHTTSSGRTRVWTQSAHDQPRQDGPWARSAWLPCRDGKDRPVEPGISPLVDGLPRGVVPSGDSHDAGYANATAEARVMRLRGYGNAIVPQVAAEFIGAYLDAIPEA